MNKSRKLLNSILSNYYLLQLKRDQWRNPQKLKNIQFKKLKTIVKYAYMYIPYYHRLFASAKIKPSDIKKADDFKRIPLTSKQDLQNNPSRMIPQGINSVNFRTKFTSGSTGYPLNILHDWNHIKHANASARYSFFENGLRVRDRFATIWGRAQSILWTKAYVKLLEGINEIVIPVYQQEKLIKVLQSIKADVINTFPSVLSSLAASDVREINPRLIFTQGEVVTPHCREVVKKLFDSGLFEIYGSVEFSHLAFECTEHCGLHMLTNDAYIEFVDEEGEPVAPGEEGEIVVTGLNNRVMPLIRYRIGDLGIPTNEKCPCGRTWPLLRNVQGRSNDYFILTSGRKIIFHHFYHHVYKELEKNVFSFSQFMMIQDKKDRIILQVVKGQKYEPKMLERIKHNLETYFLSIGEKMEVVTEVVKEIPLERTGKRRKIIRNVINQNKNVAVGL